MLENIYMSFDRCLDLTPQYCHMVYEFLVNPHCIDSSPISDRPINQIGMFNDKLQQIGKSNTGFLF